MPHTPAATAAEQLQQDARAKIIARTYHADAPGGRLLLALRAGRMCTEQLYARFGHMLTSARQRAVKDGFVGQANGYAFITDAGLAVCPKRAG